MDGAYLNCMIYIKKMYTKPDRLQIYCISGIKLHNGYSFPINFLIPYARRQEDFT